MYLRELEPSPAPSIKGNPLLSHKHKSYKSTVLPRQFYRMPAHEHYDIWPARLHKTCSNPVDLLSLYEQIREEDWWYLRSRQAPGWSEDCIPDGDHRECC